METALNRSDVAELIERARDGERIRQREKRGLTLGERLRVQAAEREVLHEMSPQERIRSYRRGRLSGYQLSVWWSTYPNEVPRIDGHPEWIAATLVDVCESPHYVERLRELGVRRLQGQPW